MNSDGAAFILYPLGGTSLTINDYTCTKSECSESLLTNERMNLTFYSQKFYLLQQENGTLVGTGDHDCPQDLSTTCKYGIMNPSCPMESCLCEGDIQCIFPADFDTCPSTTDAMFTTTPMTPIIPFIITAYFGNSTYMEEAVMVTRTDMSSQEATFTIYSLRRFSIQINNIQCDKKCDVTVPSNTRVNISLDNFLQFFLYQETNNTLVGVGENCIQDISTDCKSGKSIPSNAYSTCLCEGKEVCSLPANFDICDENSAITTLTTVETTESFTTETLPSAFTVSAFYGYYMANMQRVVVVQRTVFDSTGANFTIYQTSSIPVQVDGIPCDDNCTRRVDADSRMDINVNGALQFYLYEHSNGTLVGIGEDTCVQDLSEQCKSGKPDPNESIYACLCEGGRTCTSSNEFDSCNLHPEITSSTSSSTSSSLPSSTMAAVTSAEITTSQFSTSTVTNESTTATTATRITTNTTFTLPSSTSTPTTSTTSRAPTAAIPSLSDLSNSTIGQNNVTTVLNDTLIYSGSQGQLTTDQVDQIATILSKSANVIGLNQTDSLMILINMDNCLFASNAAVSDSAAMQMTSMLPTMVQNTVASSIDYLQGTNMGFSARKVNCSDYGSDQGLMDELTMFVTINGAPNANRNAIRIPLGTVCSETDISHVFFSLYRDRKLFKGPKQYRTYNNHVWQDNKPGEPIPPSGSASVRVKRESEPTVEEPPPPCLQQNSLASEAPVMSGTMLSGNGGNITSRLASAQPVAELQFNIQGLLPPLHGRFVVTWWNPETGDWATEEECETTRNGDMVVASCKHLTDFTLIVDAALNDPCVCDMGLIATGYVVNGMSIASLVFLFIVYICAFIPKFANTKAMRFVSGCATSKRDSISLSYTTSLLLFYFTFTVFSNQSVSGDACSTMASICYALFLSTIVMNIFKCIRMTVRFVPPSARDYFQFFQRALVFDTISIIVPFIISILLLLLTDFFDRNDAFCWVRVDYVVFATVIPISILILNALVATSLVAYRLFVSHLKVKKGGKHVDYNLGAKLLNLLILQFTLGMPWLLQYFTLAMPKATVWHYVFTIVLGSQGTLLVILFFHHRQRVLRSSRYAKKLASMQTQATNLSDGSSTGN